MSKSISFLGPIFTGAILLSGLALSSMANAVPLFATSYDMPNGDGRAHGGSFNYWDRDYTGTGATSGAAPMTTDREALTGGLGDLTDGVTTALQWNAVENVAGTGPYVGWRDFDPTITFNFASNVFITGVSLHLDDANGIGGVWLSASVDINGDNFAIVDPAANVPAFFTFAPLTQGGSTLTMTLHRRLSWQFIDEVTFEGRIIETMPAPEPATLTLFGLGLAGLGFARRRKNLAA